MGEDDRCKINQLLFADDTAEVVSSQGSYAYWRVGE